MHRLFVALLLLSLALPVRADEADAHFAAHFGASFALTTVVYGLMKRGLHAEPLQAYVFAATAALAVGLTYKILEPGNPPPGVLQRSMTQNALGVGAAGLTVFAFQF